ncbi:hypothetical protein LSH36_11g04006 [Paralvinella palmiformis]|uniref:Uncharacterized protein n=1 Tax=Paralvinella palmiformis TaxID=53620 RepID=A0AAD9NGL7_9ANNE|nr:hypothetical protein LSH36_11g04006 [Paralvinella palmiformis]
MAVKRTKSDSKPPREPYFCIKYTLFATNFLVWVGGVCLIVIGVWSRLEKAQLNNLSGLPTDPAFFLVSVGVVIFLTTIFGCMGSVKENVAFLKIFCVLMVIVFVLQAVASILAFIFLDKVDSFLLAYVKRAIISYQRNDELEINIDYIQKRLVAILLAHALIRVVVLSKLKTNSTHRYRPWTTRKQPQNYVIYPTPPKYPITSTQGEVNLTRL